MCKALTAIEKSSSIAAATIFLPSEPTTDLNLLHKIIAGHISRTLRFCEHYLQRYSLEIDSVSLLTVRRGVTLFEENLVSDDPRCMVWSVNPAFLSSCATHCALFRSTRTDQLIRIEVAMNGTTSECSRRLIPCPECNLSFCCSPAHWEAARALHRAPCEETCDGVLSQCEMNREVRAQIEFDAFLAETRDHHGALIWAPARTKSAWMSLEGLSWERELSDEIRKSFGISASLPAMPWIRAVSDNLTMSMTTLYGLEKLNDGDAWTRKHTLTVHVCLFFCHCRCCVPTESTIRSSTPGL